MLRFENVTFHYPGTQVGVRDVSMGIGRGELVSVIGASGSGKSTLLNLLAGFLLQDSGSILIDGSNVSAMPPEHRELGVVFQSYGLFPHMKAWENVAYPLKLRGVATADRRRRAFDALERVGMGPRAEFGVRQLSGGQQQRVALARALVFQPRGLLLDEPLSALDANLRVEMRDEILRVQRAAGIATLLVTHDQEEALSISDRVAVIVNGRLAQLADPRTLYDAPADETIARFVGHANLWPGTVAKAGEVLTGIGPLVCDTGGFNPGEAVVVLVRPERVRPVTNPSAVAHPSGEIINQFSGHVTADRFLGAIRRLDLTVDGGVIRLESQYRDMVSAVSIPPDAIRLLHPSSPSTKTDTARRPS